jgi:hypothetical protein
MDGNGPSGFTLDLTKMQMFYIDYSWYGAGFVRWGLRGIDGTIFYVHSLLNNNTNSEAYMRSGNLPGRYESSTFAPVSSITSTIEIADNVIIGANSIVTKDLDSNFIYAGNPAKKIKGLHSLVHVKKP